jgi:hypothetical protein
MFSMVASVVKFLIVFSMCSFVEMKYLIAVATGQAHDHFPVNDVVQMLMFTSDQQFLKYISV